MISDEALALAAEKAAGMLDRALPRSEDCTHAFSRRFQRKMRRLIRRERHLRLHRALRWAACVLLALLLGLGSVLSASADARAAVFGWLRQRYEAFYEYCFEGTPHSRAPVAYAPRWMPDGFVHNATLEIEGGEVFIYANSDGAIAQFTYSTTPQNLSLFIESGDFAHSTVYVHGQPGDLYLSPDPSVASGIVWTNASGDTIFSISAPAEAETLLKIAEQIEKIS